MIIDNKNLKPIFVPKVRPPLGVRNEYFYAVPNAKNYVLSDHGRLYRKNTRNGFVRVKMKFNTAMHGDAYTLHFDGKTEPETVSVRKLMAMTFFPNQKNVYLHNPKTYLYPKNRWKLSDLHVLDCRQDIVEAIRAKIERREPNYDSTKKGCRFINRPEFSEPYRDVINGMRADMQSRATNINVKAAHPHYQETTIAEDFKGSSAAFGQWFLDHWYYHPEKLVLDKDILGFGNANHYGPDHIALIPSYVNVIFGHGHSDLGYSILQKQKSNGEFYYVVPAGAFKTHGYRSKNAVCETYSQALQIARNQKAEFIRWVISKERALGFMPEYILDAMSKWASLCELGLIKMWEPSENTLIEKGAIN